MTYLMSISMHTADNIRPAGLLDIDLTFAQIVSCNEEGGFSTVRREHVKQMRRVVVRTIIECQGYNASVLTMVDSCAIVRDIANQWSRHVERRFTQRFNRSIATVRVIDLTVWTFTVLWAPTAEAYR